MQDQTLEFILPRDVVIAIHPVMNFFHWACLLVAIASGAILLWHFFRSYDELLDRNLTKYGVIVACVAGTSGYRLLDPTLGPIERSFGLFFPTLVFFGWLAFKERFEDWRIKFFWIPALISLTGLLLSRAHPEVLAYVLSKVAG